MMAYLLLQPSFSHLRLLSLRGFKPIFVFKNRNDLGRTFLLSAAAASSFFLKKASLLALSSSYLKRAQLNDPGE